MIKHYIFFVNKVLPKPNTASLVWAAHSANAAANLGYSSILVYYQEIGHPLKPVDLIRPFKPKKPDKKLANFYNIEDKLQVASLPMPWPISESGGKLNNPSTITCKYYLPIHLKPVSQIIHTRDWNFAQAAIKNEIPVIFENHHYRPEKFDSEIVNSRFFQVAVTLSDTVEENMIEQGMPPEKIIKTHSGLNGLFLRRYPEQAKEWRQKLLTNDRQHLVVYSGGLYSFKGVDLLIDVAKELPDIQFVFAGGSQPHVEKYQKLVQEKRVENVKLLGYIEQKKLASLLQSADILAHPHCSGTASTFTSPLKFFDYLASGTPIVATEIPPLQQFKSLNVVAGWCEPDNHLAFVQSIKTVLTTHPRRVEGYSDSMEFARQFSCENRIAKILNHVEESMRPQLLVKN
ncbi:MAG: glycosyltransferase [Coleofasciculaceae cyanobacterium]